KKEDKSKQPKRIQVKNRRLFAFAGLWDKWEQENETLFTCTILTKETNHFMQNIHHRMPIILSKNKQYEWIMQHKLVPQKAGQFVRQPEKDEMTAYDVDTYVNSAKNNDETCIVPLAEGTLKDREIGSKRNYNKIRIRE